MGENVVEVSEQTWDAEIVGSNKPVLVDFWAQWCAPCRIVAPVIEELAGEFSEKVKFAKLNVDDNPRIAGQFQVMSIPTFILFDKGEAKRRFMGAMPKEKFVDELSEWLG